MLIILIILVSVNLMLAAINGNFHSILGWVTALFMTISNAIGGS